MNIALISDIHANLPAIEAVMADLRTRDIAEIWDLGDFLGFGAFPDEVASLLRRERVKGILGNYDRKILKLSEKIHAWEGHKSPEKLTMWRFSWEALSEENIAYAISLPQRRTLTREGWRILAVHGSPESMDEHLGPDTPLERMEHLAAGAGVDVVVCGHSHRAFVREAGGTTFINPGSVGCADDGDPRASYAVIRVTGRSLQAGLHRVAYDTGSAAKAIRERGLHEVYARMVLTGRGYRDAMAERPEVKAMHREYAHVAQALTLGQNYAFEKSHAVQVTRLALEIFDGLKKIHGLSKHERILLECAGILHDIGITYGTRGHHKRSMDLISENPLPSFSQEENLMIALVARYHRKALPTEKHGRFTALTEKDQAVVLTLSAILRVADGLDRTHWNLVEGVRCTVRADTIVLTCATRGPAGEEIAYGLIKSDLMQEIFGRRVEIREDRRGD